MLLGLSEEYMREQQRKQKRANMALTQRSSVVGRYKLEVLLACFLWALQVAYLASCSGGVVTSRSSVPLDDEVYQEPETGDEGAEAESEEPEEQTEDPQEGSELDASEDNEPEVKNEAERGAEDAPEGSDETAASTDDVASTEEGTQSNDEDLEQEQDKNYVTSFKVQRQDKTLSVSWNVPEKLSDLGIKDYQFQMEGGAVAWQSLGTEGSYVWEGLDTTQEHTLILRVLYDDGPGEHHVVHVAAKTEDGVDGLVTVREKDPAAEVDQQASQEQQEEEEEEGEEVARDESEGQDAADAGLAHRAPVTFYVNPQATSLEVTWEVGEGPQKPRIIDYQYRINPDESWKSMLKPQEGEAGEEQQEPTDSYEIIGLEMNTTYGVSLRVVYEDVPSLATDLEFTTLSAEPKKEANEHLSMTIEARTTELWISWEKPQWMLEKDVEDFEYRIVGGDEKWSSLGSDSSYLITGLTPGTSYIVEVRVRYRSGVGEAVRIPFTTRSSHEEKSSDDSVGTSP